MNKLSIKFKYLTLNVYIVFLYFFSFVSGVFYRIYNFFRFVHLNALFVRRLKKYDVGVLSDINKIKTKTVGDWSEQLEHQPRQALLSIALDPKSAGYKTKTLNFDSFEYGGRAFKRSTNIKLKSAISKVNDKIKEIKNLEKQIKIEDDSITTKTDAKTNCINQTGES